MKTAPMLVTYLDRMGTDLTVVDAARVSFDKESEWEAFDYGTQTRLSAPDTKLIGYLAKHNHWSPFAHTSIQLRVKAPIFVARQLVKHQVGGVWNEVSRRYVDSEPEFYFPEVWRGRPINAKQGSSGVVNEITLDHMTCITGMDGTYPISDYADLTASYALALYKDMLTSGVAPEQARMILPQNMHTEWIWTGSLMFFIRVCRERLVPGAQQETREIAEQIAEIVAPLFPVSWAALMDKE